MKGLTIEELIKRLYSDNVLLGWKDFNFPLYYYIKEAFLCYSDEISNIADDEFHINPDDVYFNGMFTKNRLSNLVNRIIEAHLKILQYCYKGDLFSASKLLYQLLLCQNSKLKQYLVEPYINYLDSKVFTKEIFYRMRDEDKDKLVDNCSHVPYNLRGSIDSNRFSLQGLPCLYLANTKETANKELRSMEEGKQRWVSEFAPTRDFALTDLRFKQVELQPNMSIYDAFKLLITFPIRLLCSMKVKDEKARFHEEYYFPQLLSHLILVYLKEHPNEKLYCGTEGIMFDSTQNRTGYNIILPASYSGLLPPKEGQSKIIRTLLSEQNVTRYR